jgi:hypothetical protein
VKIVSMDESDVRLLSEHAEITIHRRSKQSSSGSFYAHPPLTNRLDALLEMGLRRGAIRDAAV